MKAKIRTLEKTDIDEVFSGWKAAFPHDDIPRQRFENIALNDPNYIAAGNLVAVQNQRVVGYVSAVVRRGIAGQDTKGTADEKDYGYIKGLFALEDYSEPLALKHALLEQALKFIKSEGKTLVKVGHYTGLFFNPGIDVRYEGEQRFYQVHGFNEVDYEEDVSVNLTDFAPLPYHDLIQKRVEQMGVAILDYKPNLLSAMKDFVLQIEYPNFFPAGWENDFDDWGSHLVAVSGVRVLGWAMYNPVLYEGYFGPIAVLPDFRRKGIGTALLLESMLRMKKEGTPVVTAGWANTPFYLKSGWSISRRYVIFERKLFSET